MENPFQHFGMPEIDDKIVRLMEQMSSLHELQDSLAELVGEGTAADGYVVVRVDHSGMVSAVELNPRAMKMASEDLSAAIVEAGQQAANDLATKAQNLFSEQVPDMPDPEQAMQDAARNGPEELAEAIKAVTQSENPAEEMARRLKDLQEHPPGN